MASDLVLNDNGSVTVTDRLGVNTATPQTTVHVEGVEVHSGGDGGGYSFADRHTKAFVPAPTQGQRWVLYAAGTDARLWSGTDRIVVDHAAGTLINGTLTVEGGVRFGGGQGWIGTYGIRVSGQDWSKKPWTLNVEYGDLTLTRTNASGQMEMASLMQLAKTVEEILTTLRKMFPNEFPTPVGKP